MHPLPSWLSLTFLLASTACDGEKGGDSGEADADTDTDTDTDTDSDTDTDPNPDVYDFPSRFTKGSSVTYTGQSLRMVLVDDMKTHLGGLTARLDKGYFPKSGDVAAELDFYFSFDSDTSGSVSILKSTDPAPLQATYSEIATDKDLVGKIAGNDAEGQHEDWATDFVGWGEDGVTSPESLVRLWFDEIDAAAVEWSNGDIPVDPDGNPVPAVYVTADGRDYRELLQKFLHGAVAYSQGTDDYLDDATEGAGLLSDHTAAAEEGGAYTTLEHAWDEGWGYFGAARDYAGYTDDLLNGVGYQDTVVADGAIDLTSEVSWGHSTNAGKRDLGAVVPTDFTADAWSGFWNGRALLASSQGALTAEQLTELQGYRDQAVGAWENAIAATVVHYINDTLKDMSAFDTKDYAFADHAKHWSELKGFALSLQFNPRSKVSDEDFVTLHGLIGTAPVLSSASSTQIEDYRQALLDARELLGQAYGFDAKNLGDDNGENGW